MNRRRIFTIVVIAAISLAFGFGPGMSAQGELQRNQAHQTPKSDSQQTAR